MSAIMALATAYEQPRINAMTATIGKGMPMAQATRVQLARPSRVMMVGV